MDVDPRLRSTGGRGLTRRDLLRVAGATAGVAFVAACTPQTTPPGIPTPGVTRPPTSKLLWGAGNSVARLDPQTSATFTDLAMFDNLFDTLTARRPPPNHRELQPRLATEWSLVNDTTWQFKLRSDVKFHNGQQLTAADVKFTMERAIDPNSRSIWRSAFSTVSRVDVIDDFTVNFVTMAFDPLLPNRLIGQGSWVMPAQYFQEVGEDGFERAPIGSGPYKFLEHVTGDHTFVAANADYWDGAPAVEGIELRAIPEISARVTALTSTEESNFSESIPSDQVDGVREGATTKVEELLYSGNYSLTPNTATPPLDKREIRQALSLAIDRESIINNLLRGEGAIPNGVTPPGDFAYDEAVPPLPYDPQRARDLLRQAGYQNEEVLLETTRNFLIQQDQALGEALVQMWRDVGINARLELLETSVRTQKIGQRAFQGLFTAAFSSYLQDPAGFMWRILQQDGPLNYGWVNDEFQRLGLEAGSSTDPDLRTRNYRRMNEIVREEVPFIAVMEFYQFFGMKQYVNFKPGPNTILNFRRDNLNFTGL
ncbi:MAG: ABC transporter substrate-binding protein [Candidatus Limnocylindria bacterium]